MTYREQIQRLILILDLANDLAGSLRDTAIGLEKEAFNTTRGSTMDAARVLRQLDNRMEDKRAAMELGDTFESYIKTTLGL